MKCNCNNNCVDEEIVVCNTLFKYTLTEVETNVYNLLAIPCNTPTAVYDIATIRTKSNTCTGLNYYQAAINTNPVEIIQDCSLCGIIANAIELYFENMEPVNCGNTKNNGFNFF